MKKTHKAVNTVSLLGGFFTIAAAVVLIVFLLMSLLGLIHPRKTRITLRTQNITTVYDGVSHMGSGITVTRGQLLPGHKLEVRSVVEYDKVGIYENAPSFVIIDKTGADVTNLYDIQYEFGQIVMQPRQIALTSEGSVKQYDGIPLTSGNVKLTGGTLIEGHSLKVDGGNSLLYPGSVTVDPNYRIITEEGVDVTDQYHVTELFGELEIKPHVIYISTGSAEKRYDSTSLSCDEWAMKGGQLLDGHTLNVRVTGVLHDPGTVPNSAEVKVYDQSGLDVTRIYDIQLELGILNMQAVPLYIKTMSDSKVYDGKPLSCNEWSLTGGELEAGATLQVLEYTVHDQIGTVDNSMKFAIIDSSGIDVTHRYEIVFDYGKLTLQSKAITIRTATAKKAYDGTALMDHSYTIVSGELCEGDQIELICTAISEVGYTENIVNTCIIYRIKPNGEQENVTAYYRITFEFGSLEITAE